MNKLHFTEKFHEMYFKMPDLHRFGLIGKALERVIGKLVKFSLDRWLSNYYLGNIGEYQLNQNQGKRKQRIICSLTSFPARIDVVWIVIESLFRQSIVPDKIILWLSEEQFVTKDLPESIRRMEEKGLEIRFCEGDIKAHKKYFYAIQEFPNDFVVTYDDDLYYDRFNLENLLKLQDSYPDNIITNRAHLMKFSNSNGILPYRKWGHNAICSKSSNSIFATGGYGTLYKNNLLHNDFCREDVFQDLSFDADDIWLKVMSLLIGTKVITNSRYGKDPIPIGTSQLEKLVNTNVVGGGNDKQLSSLLSYYNILDERFKS